MTLNNNIKIITFLLLNLTTLSCSIHNTNPENRLKYSDLHNNKIKLISVELPSGMNFDQNKLFNNLNDGLFNNFPYVDLHNTDYTQNTDYSLSIKVKKFEAKHNTSSRKDNKEKFIIYETTTILHFTYTLTDNKSGNLLITREILSTDKNSHEEQIEADICDSRSFRKSIFCELFIKPIIDATYNLVSNKPDNINEVNEIYQKFPLPTGFEEIFYQAGGDIGKSLPEPVCFDDGVILCINHFFRNILP